jgi:hypothetical protein
MPHVGTAPTVDLHYLIGSKKPPPLSTPIGLRSMGKVIALSTRDPDVPEIITGSQIKSSLQLWWVR